MKIESFFFSISRITIPEKMESNIKTTQKMLQRRPSTALKGPTFQQWGQNTAKNTFLVFVTTCFIPSGFDLFNRCLIFLKYP